MSIRLAWHRLRKGVVGVVVLVEEEEEEAVEAAQGESSALE